MESISDMFPWIEEVPKYDKTIWSARIYSWHESDDFSMPVSEKRKVKPVATINELKEIMQQLLLFPLRPTEPFICTASTLVYDKDNHRYCACIQTYPLYYGYKLFLQINEDSTYDLLLDPNIEKLFSYNISLLNKINFIPFPYNVCSNYLIDSCLNVSLKNWLLEKDTDMLKLSNDFIVRLSSYCQLETTEIEVNKILTEFIHERYKISIEERNCTLLDNFYEQLNNTYEFTQLQHLLHRVCADKVINNPDNVIDECIPLVTFYDDQCKLFLTAANCELNSYKNKSDGDRESAILEHCFTQVHECMEKMSHVSKKSQITDKIENIFRESILYHIYNDLTQASINKYEQLIYSEKIIKLLAKDKYLCKFFEARNKYKEKELPDLVNKYISAFEKVSNYVEDISDFSPSSLKDFLTFHKNAITTYPTIETDQVFQSVVNRSSVEFMYYTSIDIYRREKLQPEIFRKNSLISDHLINLCKLFNVYTLSTEEIRVIFKRQSDLLPPLFWEYTPETIKTLNDISDCIGIFSGCETPYTFKTYFYSDSSISDRILKNHDDVENFIQYIKSFMPTSPREISNYVFSVEPQEIEYNLIPNRENYKTHMRNYMSTWTGLLTQFKGTQNKIFKTIEYFNNAISDILKLSIKDLSILYKKIYSKSSDNWGNIIEFLSLKVEDNPYLDLFITLAKINKSHKNVLKLALTTSNFLSYESVTEKKITRQNVAKEILHIAFQQLYKSILILLDTLIKHQLKTEENSWTEKMEQGTLTEQPKYITVEYEKQSSKTHLVTEILTFEFCPIMEIFLAVYNKDIFNQYLTKLSRDTKDTEWKFYKVKDQESLVFLKRGETQLENIAKNNMKEIQSVSEQYLDETTHLLFLLSCYVMVIVIELFFTNRSSLFDLLSKLESKTLRHAIDDNKINLGISTALETFPCYGLIKVINVNNRSTTSMNKMRLKHQILVCRKMHGKMYLNENIANPLYFINNASHNKNEELVDDFLSCLIKMQQNLQIPLSLFEELLHIDYWTEQLFKDMKELQTIWATSKDMFRFKYHVGPSATFQTLAVTGVNYSDELPIFTDIFLATQKKINSIFLVSHSCLNETNESEEKNENTPILDTNTTIKHWIENHLTIRTHISKTDHALEDPVSPFDYGNSVENNSPVSLDTSLSIRDWRTDDDDDDDDEDEDIESNKNYDDDDPAATATILADDDDVNLRRSAEYDASCTKSKLYSGDKPKEEESIHFINKEHRVIFNTSNFHGHMELLKDLEEKTRHYFKKLVLK